VRGGSCDLIFRLFGKKIADFTGRSSSLLAAFFIIPTENGWPIWQHSNSEGMTPQRFVFSGRVRPMIYPSIGCAPARSACLSNAEWSKPSADVQAEALEIGA